MTLRIRIVAYIVGDGAEVAATDPLEDLDGRCGPGAVQNDRGTQLRQGRHAHDDSPGGDPWHHDRDDPLIKESTGGMLRLIEASSTEG